MTPEELKMVVEALDERSSRRTRRWIFASIVGLGVLVPTVLFATTITVPNTFTANTPARASEVNANFAVLAAEATRVSNIVLGPTDAGNQIVGLAPPIAGTDAANKAYIDAASGSAGAPALTLFGITTCPTGWTVALTGTIYVGHATKVAATDTVAVSPPVDLVCMGSSVSLATSLTGPINPPGNSTRTPVLFRNYGLNNDTGTNTTGVCVICVK